MSLAPAADRLFQVVRNIAWTAQRLGVDFTAEMSGSLHEIIETMEYDNLADSTPIQGKTNAYIYLLLADQLVAD